MVIAKCSFRCKDKCASLNKMKSFNVNGGCGYKDFLKREAVFENYLNEDGTLVINLDIQIAVDTENDAVWYPKLNISIDILTQLYHSSSEDDTNTSNAVFDVDGK